jgi:hypothetical protein
MADAPLPAVGVAADVAPAAPQCVRTIGDEDARDQVRHGGLGIAGLPTVLLPAATGQSHDDLPPPVSMRESGISCASVCGDRSSSSCCPLGLAAIPDQFDAVLGGRTDMVDRPTHCLAGSVVRAWPFRTPRHHGKRLGRQTARDLTQHMWHVACSTANYATFPAISRYSGRIP